MKTKKQPLRQEDVELLDQIISRLNQALLWHLNWGIFGTVDAKSAKELEARFKKRREKEGKEFPITRLDEEYELNKQFFRDLNVLLVEFTKRDGLGIEYDKRRAEQFSRTISALEKIARD